MEIDQFYHGMQSFIAICQQESEFLKTAGIGTILS